MENYMLCPIVCLKIRSNADLIRSQNKFRRKSNLKLRFPLSKHRILILLDHSPTPLRRKKKVTVWIRTSNLPRQTSHSTFRILGLIRTQDFYTWWIFKWSKICKITSRQCLIRFKILPPTTQSTDFLSYLLSLFARLYIFENKIRFIKLWNFHLICSWPESA